MLSSFNRPLVLTLIVIGMGLVQSIAPGKAFAAEITSHQNGDWSASSTWQGGSVPGPEDAVTIGHLVIYDLPKSRVSGVTISETGHLVFSPGKSVVLETDKNLLNRGTLEMRPASPSILHRLRFVDVDETKFVGSGMEVLGTDVGLWTTANGRLDAIGAAKTPWTRLTSSAKGGETRITVHDAEGWQIGDTIVVVPTEHPRVGARAWDGFEERRIEAIDGAIIDLDRSLDHDHPEVENPFNDNRYTAEVLNLTRNIRIEGVGNHSPSFRPHENGRAHVIFLATKQPQIIKYIELSHLGPRQPDGKFTTGIEGRYPLHFHHAGDGSRGTQIEGVVARQSGNRAFVPHASHGITLKETIAYDVFDDAYWWDRPPKGARDPERRSVNDTHDLLITRAVAARVANHPTFRGFRLSGYTLGDGRQSSLTLRDSVAIGVQGNRTSSGFHWPEVGRTMWNFDSNIAHNNKVSGIFVWQNNDNPHEIKHFVAYHNGGVGTDHGAYGNNYRYSDLFLFGNGEAGFSSRAAANGPPYREDGYTHTIERLRTTGTFFIGEHNSEYAAPTLVKDSVVGHIKVDERGKDLPGYYDFVNVTTADGVSIEPSDFTLIAPKLQSVYRVQRPDGTAFRIVGDKSITQINAFYHPPDTKTLNGRPSPAGSLVGKD